MRESQKYLNRRRAFGSGAALAALLVGVNAGGALAQQSADAETTIEEVVITGSRIKRAGFDTLQPAVVVDAEALSDRAMTNVGDALNELPSFGVPDTSQVGTQAGLGVGQNFVNFLGLGSQRTLTVVNGKRFVGANTPSTAGGASPGLQVDLNTIPVALIERIETIAVGGAPIYGSDAIAGTVNIILKKDFEGFETMARGGISQKGDAEDYTVQATYGVNFDDDRGNIVFSFDHSQQNGLKASDREVSGEYLSFEAPSDPNSPYDSVLIRDSRVGVSNFNGLVIGVPFNDTSGAFPGPLSINGIPQVPWAFNLLGGGLRDSNGNLTQFGPDGNVITFDPGQPTGSLVFKSGGDGFSIGDTNALLTDNSRQLANMIFNYRIADNVQMHAEGWYSHTRNTNLVAQPSYNGLAFGTPEETLTYRRNGLVPMRLDNPFVTDQARGIIGAGLDFDGDGAPDLNADYDGDGVADATVFWVDKGHQDILNGTQFTGKQNLYRGLIGFEGDFDAGGRNISWDATYSYGQTVGSTTAGVIYNDKFSRAIDAVRDPDSGEIVCRDQSDGRCAPLNVMGYGAPSEAAIAYVSGVATATTKIDQHFVSLNASTDLFDLPAGTVGFAVGVDYRHEKSVYTPDETLRSADIRSPALSSGSAIVGSFNTKEIYAETLIPVVSPDQDISFLRSFELEAAARYVDHSTAGGDLTWTAGGRLSPMEGLILRGNYTVSIRNPSITELFLPSTEIFARAADPCDQRNYNQGANASVRAANCSADGITQPFNSLIVNASQRGTLSGNNQLESEKAKAWTLGAIFKPSFVPGLTLSADWVNIKLQNAIENLGVAQILEACYDSVDFRANSVCSLFTRDSQHQVRSFQSGFANAGLRDFAGLTVDAAYDLDLADAGAMRMSVNYFYLDKLVTSVTGSDINPSAGEVGNSRHRVTANVGYYLDDLRFTVQTRYLSSAVFDKEDTENTRDVKGIGSWWNVNAGLGYHINETFDVQANVDNVFNSKPPQFALAARDTGTSTYFSSVIGRTFALTLRARF